MNNVVAQFLEETGLKYTYNDELDSYEFGLRVNNGTVHVRMVARDKDDLFYVAVSWDGHLPMRSIPLVLPLINQINYHTRFTTLAVDPEDGELTSHCSFNTDDSMLSTKQVSLTLQFAVSVLDENISKIMRMAWSAPDNSDGKFN